MPDRHDYMKKWRDSHRTQVRKSTRKFYWSLKNKVFAKLGNRCSNSACQWLNPDGSRGCEDWRCLQIDHVNNDGYKDQQNRQLGTFLKMVLTDTQGRFQLLCANCNWLKRAVNNGYIKP